MNIPNILSLTRLLLTPAFVVSVIYRAESGVFLSNLPLIIFLIAVITDAVDGFVARKYNEVTSFGILLDPLADKFLIIASFITFSFLTYGPAGLRIPPWVLIIVLTRDLFILMGAAVIYMVFGYMEFKPSMWGKATTLFQMLTIFSVLIGFNYACIIWTMAVVLTVVSGMHYLARTNRVLHEKAKRI